ncbi:MAG: winged helix-turn-helix domain-containing protein [Acidobacteriaceae bacterium]|nr:winged helix-turn-helix domain-containing protein [Acidobacteriaceae bacterium]
MGGKSYSFGPFRLLPSEHLLLRGDTAIPLAPKSFELLVVLVTRHGQLLTRDELMQAIWPDSFVEEINLTVNISLLRKVLGEQSDGRQYIATVPKRGYRFDAPIREAGQIAEEAAPAAPLLPSVPASSDSAPAQLAPETRRARSLALKWPAIAIIVLIVAGIAWITYRRLVNPKSTEATHAGASRAHDTVNSQALELYTQGRALWAKRSPESVQKSIEMFRQAIAIDPNYAAAYAGLADAYILAGSYGNSFLAPRTAMPKAKEAVEKALALDTNSPEAHTSLAYIKLTYDWDWKGAEAEFRRALDLDPNYINAHHWYSHELMAQGRVQESHFQSEEALNLEPANVLMNEHMAWHHLMAREYDRSIPQALKTIEIDPNFVQAHRVLALDYLYTGQFAKACSEFQKGVELSHDDPVARAYLARCYALSHRKAESRQILDALVKASVERYISSAEIAAVYAALRDDNSTIEWLNKACDEHASALIYINIDPVYDHLRRDRRFQKVVTCVHLIPLADESVK